LSILDRLFSCLLILYFKYIKIGIFFLRSMRPWAYARPLPTVGYAGPFRRLWQCTGCGKKYSSHFMCHFLSNRWEFWSEIFARLLPIHTRAKVPKGIQLFLTQTKLLDLLRSHHIVFSHVHLQHNVCRTKACHVSLSQIWHAARSELFFPILTFSIVYYPNLVFVDVLPRLACKISLFLPVLCTCRINCPRRLASALKERSVILYDSLSLTASNTNSRLKQMFNWVINVTIISHYILRFAKFFYILCI